MSVTAWPGQHRDESQGQPCRDHPPGLCPAPKRSPDGAWCPKKRGDPAFPPLPWPWCHLLPPLLLVGQQPLALGRGRCRAGRPTPRAPKPELVEQRLSAIFYYFFLLGGGFLLPSRFNKLTPPSSPCQYEQPETIPPFKSNSGLASKWTSNVKYRFSSR